MGQLMHTLFQGRSDGVGGARGNFQHSERYAVGPNGEPELTLEGRYDDDDHKVLAIYGAFLVGEKCRPTEKTNLVNFAESLLVKFQYICLYTEDDTYNETVLNFNHTAFIKTCKELQDESTKFMLLRINILF